MCTERSHILKQTCTWKLQFCLRICDLLVASVKGLRKSFSVDFFCQNTEIVLLLCSYFSKPFFYVTITFWITELQLSRIFLKYCTHPFSSNTSENFIIRWSKVQPVPLLGDENTSQDDVHAFYTFWYFWFNCYFDVIEVGDMLKKLQNSVPR